MVEWLETRKDITYLVFCFSLGEKKRTADYEIVKIKRQKERTIVLVLFIEASRD